MRSSIWKKLVCVGLIAAAAAVSGCGSENRVAVVDYQKLETGSPKIKSIEQEITNKDKEISDRLAEQSQTLSSDEYKKRNAAAMQERQIFMQSKQKQIQALVESQCAAIAKEKQIGIVMQSGSVPFGAIDITDEVLSRIEGTGTASSGQNQAASSQSK